MDTKKQIDSDLTAIGKDRKWLAESTGYSYFSVRDCLAPDGKKLSPRMYQAFKDAIEKQRIASSESPALDSPPDRITILVDSSRMDSYQEAAKIARQTLKQWTIRELDRAAEEWAKLTKSSLSVVAEEARDKAK